MMSEFEADGTTTIANEIRKLNLAYQRVDQRHQYQKDDLVFTRGPMKENGLYPVHTTLRDGTSCILLIGPENLILSSPATTSRHS